MLQGLYSRTARWVLALGLSGVVTAPALAQWRWCQPWNYRRDSYESHVLNCTQPSALDVLAFDDFQIDPNDVPPGANGLPIRRVVWWGVLTNTPAIANPPEFRIAFHRELDCQPGPLIAQFCPVKARYKKVGTDCTGQPVFRFSARIAPAAAPFTLPAGHYFLSIAEVDAGQDPPRQDFRWSGHIRRKLCPALQRDAAGAVRQPLFSVCDQRVNDLAFCLYGRTITIIGPVAPNLTVTLYEPGKPDPLEVIAMEAVEPGRFEGSSFVPDGTYELRIEAGGALDDVQTVQLVDAADYILWRENVAGDADNSDDIGLDDLLLVLAGFGLVSP